jgi:hypothetical protein
MKVRRLSSELLPVFGLSSVFLPALEIKINNPINAKATATTATAFVSSDGLQ